MKAKHFATIILTSLLIATVFGSVTVFAPAPPTPNLNSILDVFVTNTNDNPVPVDITDEPVEVTNPSGESLNANISGWLHTTKTGYESSYIVDGVVRSLMYIETKGYRQLTIGINIADNDCNFQFWWYAGNLLVYEDEFTAHVGTNFLKFDVAGEELDMRVSSPGPNDGEIDFATYYLTT